MFYIQTDINGRNENQSGTRALTSLRVRYRLSPLTIHLSTFCIDSARVIDASNTTTCYDMFH